MTSDETIRVGQPWNERRWARGRPMATRGVCDRFCVNAAKAARSSSGLGLLVILVMTVIGAATNGRGYAGFFRAQVNSHQVRAAQAALTPMPAASFATPMVPPCFPRSDTTPTTT